MPFGAIDTPAQGRTISGVVNNVAWVDFTKAFAPRQQAQTKRQSWMRRHPVLSGALIGSGVGALGGATFGSDCGRAEHFCSRTGMVQISTAAGAGVGALVGLAVGLIR